MLHTKKQIKNAIDLAERAKKLENHVFSGFQAPFCLSKDPNFHFDLIIRYDQIFPLTWIRSTTTTSCVCVCCLELIAQIRALHDLKIRVVVKIS